ncbi:MAG: hypothetical protein JXA51_06350 [Dehalococcoidales bacterium]|nr:hypothetical protein [Dehalococcoidales bacterium]
MRYLFAFLAVLMIAMLPAGTYAQEPSEGTVSGQVINGTVDGGDVGGVQVSLITYVEGQLAGTVAITSDADGYFQFNDVSLDNSYLVSAKYLDVDYYYPVVFESGETMAYVEVGVCDTTGSDEYIMVGLTRKIINIDDEGLLVTEVYWLVNDGDRTYVGADGVLFFTLPEGVCCFEAPEELLVDFRLLDDSRLTYLVPFPPGERQLIYTYRLDRPDSRELDIVLPVDYPTDAYELMVAGGDIEVTVSQLAPVEPVVTESGEQYIYFQGNGFSPGEAVNVRLTGFSGSGGYPSYVQWVLIAVAVVAIVVYMIRRTRKTNSNG